MKNVQKNELKLHQRQAGNVYKQSFFLVIYLALRVLSLSFSEYIFNLHCLPFTVCERVFSFYYFHRTTNERLHLCIYKVCIMIKIG